MWPSSSSTTIEVLFSNHVYSTNFAILFLNSDCLGYFCLWRDKVGREKVHEMRICRSLRIFIEHVERELMLATSAADRIRGNRFKRGSGNAEVLPLSKIKYAFEIQDHFR